MDFLCKMSVSNIYFKVSFLVTINKFSTTSSASLPLPKICRWRWHPKCPQIWVTASQPLFFPLHTHWVPPRPTSRLPLVEGSRMMAVAGRAAAAKGFITLHWEFHCCSTEKKEDKGLQLDHWVSLGLLGMEGDQKGGGRRHRGRGRSSISQFTSGTELMVISWGERGETEPPEKCLREKNTSGRRRRDEGWGSRGGGYSHTICVTSLALFLSLLKAREHLRGSPLLHKTKKKHSQMYFLLTQRL